MPRVVFEVTRASFVTGGDRKSLSVSMASVKKGYAYQRSRRARITKINPAMAESPGISSNVSEEMTTRVTAQNEQIAMLTQINPQAPLEQNRRMRRLSGAEDCGLSGKILFPGVSVR